MGRSWQNVIKKCVKYSIYANFEILHRNFSAGAQNMLVFSLIQSNTATNTWQKRTFKAFTWVVGRTKILLLWLQITVFNFLYHHPLKIKTSISFSLFTHKTVYIAHQKTNLEMDMCQDCIKSRIHETECCTSSIVQGISSNCSLCCCKVRFDARLFWRVLRMSGEQWSLKLKVSAAELRISVEKKTFLELRAYFTDRMSHEKSMWADVWLNFPLIKTFNFWNCLLNE